jgi:hypothetical protein
MGISIDKPITAALELIERSARTGDKAHLPAELSRALIAAPSLRATPRDAHQGADRIVGTPGKGRRASQAGNDNAARVQLGPFWLWHRRERDEWCVCWWDDDRR